MPLKKENDDRFRILFENASDAIFIIDLKTGEIESANKEVQELIGQPISMVLGKSVKILGEIAKIFKKEGLHEGVQILRRDGSKRIVTCSVRKIIHDSHSWSFLILRDTTQKQLIERELITKHAALKNAYLELEKKTAELESMQRSLVQAGKMTALGRLAAGVAHELNQPLTAISGFAQELEAVYKDKKIDDDYVGEIISAADKMSRIIGQLRVFGRKADEGNTQVELKVVVNDVLSLLRAQLKNRGIKVTAEIPDGLPKVFCNPFQLEQVVINLITNARDAIQEANNNKGKIKIKVFEEKKKEQVVIEVTDNGTGIPESAVNNIFDPFYTTKEVGKGMGLGLSIVYGILDKVNGTIVASNSPGSGANLKVILPIDFRKTDGPNPFKTSEKEAA